MDLTGDLTWEYVNNLTPGEVKPSMSRSYPVCSAYCYGADYSGLRKGAKQKQEAAPGNEDKEEKAIASRLERLGY